MTDLSAIYNRSPANSANGKGRTLPSRSSRGTQRSSASLSKVEPWVDNDAMELISNPGSAKVPRKLMRIISRGNVVKAFDPAQDSKSRFIKDGFNFDGGIDDLDSEGQSVLHRAVRVDHVDAVTGILDKGANIDVLGKNGFTPLHSAVSFQCTESVKVLLERGADPSISNEHHLSPLHTAARRGFTEIASFLLKDPRMHVDSVNIGKMTPLHMGCVDGHQALCELLLRNGANVFARTDSFYTPLHIAAFRGFEELCELLIETASKTLPSLNAFLEAKTSEGITVLHAGCIQGHSGVVDLLVRHGADYEAQSYITCKTPLHVAAARGHLTVVELLILYGVNIDSKDSSQKTPMHHAAAFDHSRIVEFLLENGADLEAKDSLGLTPFLLTVVHEAQRAAELLLDRGANIMATDSSLNSCLHLAVKNGKAEIVKRLLDIDKDNLLQQRDKDLKTALHLAAALEDAKILKIILQEGGLDLLRQRDINEMAPLHVAAEKGSLQCVEEMSKYDNFILNDRDDRGMTPLHLAVSNKHTNMCDLLIKKGADVTSKNSENSAPLHLAVKAGSLKTVKLLLDPLLPSTLEEKDADLNTPLHIACMYGRLDILQFLLSREADVTARNNNNMTCLDIAIKWDASEVAKILVKHKRWKDVLEFSRKDDSIPMKKLIEKLPDVAEIVLDQCLTSGCLPASHEDFSVKFDFTPLDPCDHGNCNSDGAFFAPASMAHYRRERLLNHPVTQALLRWKWMVLGKFVGLFDFLITTVFVILFSVLVVMERDKLRLSLSASNSTLNLEGSFTATVPYLIFVFIVVQSIKEIVQMFWLRMQYFRDPSNLFDLVMIAMVAIFILPYVSKKDIFGSAQLRWTAGVLGLLFAYISLTLSLRRVGGIGLYVMMYVEVLFSFIKVVLIFSFVLVGYSLVFFVLLTEQDSFSSWWLALAKTHVMMVGEIDYSDIYDENVASNNTVPGTNISYVPFPKLTGVLFLSFIFMVSVALMNLLVGLAVGDIASIQKNASLRTLVDQALLVDHIQRSYPSFIMRRVHRYSWEMKPNQNSYLKRVIFAGNGFTDQDFLNRLVTRNNSSEEKEDDDFYSNDRLRMERQEKSIERLQATVDAQSKLLRAIADRLQLTE